MDITNANGQFTNADMRALERIKGEVRRALSSYDMIADSDLVAVGISGGKDSTALLYILSELRRFYPVNFDVCAVTVDSGFDGMNFAPLSEFCRALGVEHHIVRTDIAKIVFDFRREPNPCSLCSKMRRGALIDEAHRLGCSRLALGHHFDDVVDTFMLNLIHGGRLETFEPVTYYEDKQLSVIRPLIYVREHELARFGKSLPVVKSTCPADKKTERERVKSAVDALGAQGNLDRDIRERIFHAIERARICGWHECERGKKYGR